MAREVIQLQAGGTTSGASESVRDMAQQQQHHHVSGVDQRDHILHLQHEPSQHQIAAFHVNRPSHSIAAIISPSQSLHHTASLILDQDHPFQIPRMMLPAEHNFPVSSQVHLGPN